MSVLLKKCELLNVNRDTFDAFDICYTSALDTDKARVEIRCLLLRCRKMFLKARHVVLQRNDRLGYICSNFLAHND